MVKRGWYAIARSEDVGEEPTAIEDRMGKRFVAWRLDDAINVADAFCPHLGADLSMGSIVDGCLRCPFHGWLFNDSGENVHIPYCDKLNRAARLTMYPTCERYGKVWIYVGDDEPFHMAPVIEDSWVLAEEHERKTKTNIADCLENGVDIGHFNQLHEQPGIELFDWEIPETDGPHPWVTLRYPDINLWVYIRYWGPGLVTLRFGGFVDMTMVVTYTPSNDNGTHFYVQFWFPPEGTDESLARYMVKEITHQFDQDVAVWDRKIYLEHPKLCIADGPMLKMRRWVRRFVDSGVGV